MLIIEENKVVTFEYTLKNNSGEIIDTSANHAPLVYIHGAGNIIPGLEAELEGKIAIPDITTTFGPAMVYMASDYKGVDVTSDNGEAAFAAHPSGGVP